MNTTYRKLLFEVSVAPFGGVEGLLVVFVTTEAMLEVKFKVSRMQII